MAMYVVEFRHWESSFGEEDVYSVRETVQADSMHEAIGIAYPLMQAEVELHEGGIDDLDAWIVELPSMSERESIAYIIFRAITLKDYNAWVTLGTKEKEGYIRAADAVRRATAGG